MSQVLKLAPNTTKGESSAVQDVSACSRSLWAVVSEHFDSTLIIIPAPSSDSDSTKKSFSAKLSFYDADGFVFNESGVACSSSAGIKLPLKPFFEGCKLESGYSHGQIAIRSDVPARYVCQFEHDGQRSYYQPSAHPLFKSSHALPVTFSPNKKNIISLSSMESGELKIRLRLYVGNRKPEYIVTLNPRSSKMLVLEDLFPDFSSFEDSSEVVPSGGAEARNTKTQCYLRISLASPKMCSVFHMQMNHSNNETFSVGAVL